MTVIVALRQIKPYKIKKLIKILIKASELLSTVSVCWYLSATLKTEWSDQNKTSGKITYDNKEMGLENS